ncbi:hypothetical protein [Nocardia sp. NPDC004722]
MAETLKANAPDNSQLRWNEVPPLAVLAPTPHSCGWWYLIVKSEVREKSAHFEVVAVSGTADDTIDTIVELPR